MKSKKFLLSLLLSVAGLTNAMATTRTIFSMTVNDGASASVPAKTDDVNGTLDLSTCANVTGGTATLENSNEAEKSFVNSGVISINKNSGAWIKIELLSGYSLKAGDVITLSKNVEGSALDNGVNICPTSSRVTTIATTNTYTVTASDIIHGKTTFYIHGSAKNNATIKTITITREVSASDNQITYDFTQFVGSSWTNISLSETSITNTAGGTVYLLPDVVDVINLKDKFAVSTGSTLRKNTSGLNFGAKRKYLSILNMAKGDIISITYSGNVTHTFNGELPYTYLVEGTPTAVTSGSSIESGTEYTMTADGSFDIYSPNSNNSTITSITIKTSSASCTAGAGGYKSFSSTYNFFVSGADAYYAPDAPGASSITLTKIDASSVIPANEGVILKAANEGDAISIGLTTDVATATLTGNKLKPVTTAMNASELIADNAYILSNGQFCKVIEGASGSLAAGKAYLSYAVSETKSFNIEFDDASGIEETNISPTLSTSEGVYNLQGMKVNENYKGVVIKNGKKYFNK